GRADVSRVEQAFTDYLNTTSWAIALILLRAPRWMPYPGRRRAERARTGYNIAATLTALLRRRSMPLLRGVG
ncbi:MAG: cytochrome P450, partial [Gemmatimonadales bacterium]